MSNTLLKLATTDNKGLFDNDLYEDLIVPPYSSIALQNISIQHTPDSLVVDNSNDTITYNLTAGQNNVTFQLNHSSYNDNNYKALIDDFNEKLNNSLIYSVANPLQSKANGSEFLFSINPLSKRELQYRLSRYYIPDPASQTDCEMSPNMKVTNGTNVTTNYFSSTDRLDARLSSSSPFVRGSGSLTFQIKNMLDNLGCDVIVGFFKTSPTAPVNFQLNNINNAIRFSKPIAQTYADVFRILDGVETAVVGPQANNNYFFSFEKYQATLRCKMYDDTGTLVDNMYNKFIDYSVNLYPFIWIINGGETAPANYDIRIGRVKFMRTNFLTLNDDKTQPENQLGAIPSQQGAFTNSTVTMNINPTLAEYIGLGNNPQIQVNNVIDSFDFTFPDKFHESYTPESIMIEMLNIPLKSYDFSQNKKRSLLSVVPNIQFVKNRLIYDSQYPLYITIDNKEPLLLRNITCRLLNSDNSELQLNGESFLTLLIKSNDSKYNSNDLNLLE